MRACCSLTTIPWFGKGVRRLLEKEEFRIVGEGSDGLEVVALAEQVQPDIIVLESPMPTLNGVGAVRGMRERRQEPR